MVEYLPVDILMVDRDLSHVKATQLALRDAKIRNRIHAVETANAALEYLAQTHEEGRLPHCVMLCMDLDSIDGEQLSRALRDTPIYARIPTVALAPVASHTGVLERCRGAADFLASKPFDVEQLVSVIRSCESLYIRLIADRRS